ncbi:hypothetical protein BBJ28_00023155 [Nothophytophthora sp. Chile5]|nr:hypothetical protein BBJ28_00023155 [Nothophytophthora sp. Chile5]
MSGRAASAAAATGRSANLWIRGVLLLLLATGVLALVLEASSLDYGQALRRVAPAGGVGNASSLGQDGAQQLVQHAVPQSPTLEDWMTTDPPAGTGEAAAKSSSAISSQNSNVDEVSAADLYHLSLLHGACIANKDAIVTWEFGAPGDQQDNETSNRATLIYQDDPELLSKLRQCPDVDLFLPSDVRNNGYCEDSMAYTKYLNSRLLPLWALTIELFDPELGRKVDYFDLCPKTAMLFFQHYWEGVPNSPRWPKEKQMYLMPNIEMWELDETHFWRVDVVLCKTRICEDRVTKWYKQEGNPRNSQVVYTKHTSSDQAGYARRVLGDQVKPKDFSDVRFIHTVGGSYWKGTRQVLECWLSRPDFPPLDLYVHKWAYDGMFKGRYEQRISNSQIKLTTDEVDALTFTKAVAENAYFLCPSQMEGYGHYMNQARASGGVIVTTDMDPMKELLPTDDMGLRVPSKPGSDRNIFLGGSSKKEHGLKGVPGMVAQFTSKDLCGTVDHLLKDYSVDQREAMGVNARRQYHEDTQFFALAMRKLRVLAQRQAGTYHSASSSTEAAEKDETPEDNEPRKRLRREPDE